MALAIPTVHLNGTSKQELLDQLLAAMNAVRAAQQALARACPHGRDFYVQAGDEPLLAALRQHRARQQKLLDVEDELQKIAEAVDDQQGGR